MYKVKVFVTLKAAVLDPQGKAINNSLAALEIINVDDVRVGKYIEFDIKVTERNEAEALVTEVCEKVLVNQVIEDYHYELVEVS